MNDAPPNGPPGPQRHPRAEGLPLRGELVRGSLVPFAGATAALGALGPALGTAWRRRARAGYAARILREAVCHGCSLGPRGLRDDAGEALHLCARRVATLGEATDAALAPADVADLGRLRGATAAELRGLGRLPYPFVHRAGTRGFDRISWDEALALAGAALRAAPPERQLWVGGGAEPTNEAWYALAKSARAAGAENLDFAGGAAWRAGLAGAAAVTGWDAPTCSLSDVVGADLVILWSADVGARQPMMRRTLLEAKRVGTRVVVVSPQPERALARYAPPTLGLNGVLGARLTDDPIPVGPGGEAALARAVLVQLARWNALDAGFLAEHATGWDPAVAAEDLAALSDAAGVTASELEWLSALFARARTVVSVWSAGGAPALPDGGRALATLHVATGQLGRPKAGLLPLALDPGVPGAADCGLLGADAAGALARHPAFVYALGGDLLCGAAEPDRAVAALTQVGARVHQDTHLTPCALLEPAQLTVLLPMQSRHEQPGGGTVTSAERRVRYTAEIAGHPRIGESRPAWEIPGLVVAAAWPERAAGVRFADARAVRAEMSAAIERYRGLDALDAPGDALQWGGAQLLGFGHPDGKAHLA